jgi:hypothetical protein
MPGHIYERKKEKLSRFYFLILKANTGTNQAYRRETKPLVLPATDIPYVHTKLHGTTEHDRHSMTTAIKCTTPLRWSITARESNAALAIRKGTAPV